MKKNVYMYCGNAKKVIEKEAIQSAIKETKYTRFVTFTEKKHFQKYWYAQISSSIQKAERIDTLFPTFPE